MYKHIKFEQNRSIDDAKIIYKQRISDALMIYKKHNHNFFVRSCFLCGENSFKNLPKFHDTYEIKLCNFCLSQSVNPVPNIEALNDYYNNAKCNVLLDDLLKSRHRKDSDFILDERVKVVLDLVSKLTKKDIRILEIGCGSGAFLAKLKYFLKIQFPSKNVTLSGIDIDANAISTSVDSELMLNVANAEEYVKKEPNEFDIILHFELIEHLPDPYSFMCNLYDLLDSNGYMFFSTPNADGLEIRAAGYNDFRLLAHSIFPPMHLNAFSLSNIGQFATRCRFFVMEITTPGSLDIDMLSHCENDIGEPLKKICSLDDDTKGLIQYLVKFLRGSSHMRCTFKKM